MTGQKTFDLLPLLENISSMIPLGLPFSIMCIGLRKMKNMIYEEKIGDIYKKDLLKYLISNRFVIENLSYDEIKQYYKYFKQIYKRRRFDNFKKHLLFWKKGKENEEC